MTRGLNPGKVGKRELYWMVYWALYRFRETFYATKKMSFDSKWLIRRLMGVTGLQNRTLHGHLIRLSELEVITYRLGAVGLGDGLFREESLQEIVRVAEEHGEVVPSDFWDKVTTFREKMGITED